jgi:hypothetical protein
MADEHRSFSLHVGDQTIIIKPDPEAPGKSLLIINNELYHADFRYDGDRRLSQLARDDDRR